MAIIVKDEFAEERVERAKKVKALQFLEGLISQLEAIDLETMDDPLLFENYKCKPCKDMHCVLIPTDAIPLFEPFAAGLDEIDKNDERYDLYDPARFQTVPIPADNLKSMFTIVQHITNCVMQFVTKDSAAHWAVGEFDEHTAETYIRLFFAAVASTNCYMCLSETSIYMRSLASFYAALCFHFGIFAGVVCLLLADYYSELMTAIKNDFHVY